MIYTAYILFLFLAVETGKHSLQYLPYFFDMSNIHGIYALTRYLIRTLSYGPEPTREPLITSQVFFQLNHHSICLTSPLSKPPVHAHHCAIASVLDKDFIFSLKKRLHPSRCIPPINALVHHDGIEPPTCCRIILLACALNHGLCKFCNRSADELMARFFLSKEVCVIQRTPSNQI